MHRTYEVVQYYSYGFCSGGFLQYSRGHKCPNIAVCLPGVAVADDILKYWRSWISCGAPWVEYPLLTSLRNVVRIGALQRKAWPDIPAVNRKVCNLYD